jgi:GDP-4-dehydro-6-deoxy-D-mannose reductase
MLGFQYFRSYGLGIIRTRGYNHTGPRRGPVFICSDFAHQITDIEKGQRKSVMKVGNLDAIRDFTDVRDMVKGYWLAVTKCREGDVYNICSNNSFSMREILNKLLTMTDVEIKLEVDESRMRPSDVPVLRGDYSKFHECTGWSPKIDFDQTLSDLLEYWRSDPGAA